MCTKICSFPFNNFKILLTNIYYQGVKLDKYFKIWCHENCIQIFLAYAEYNRCSHNTLFRIYNIICETKHILLQDLRFKKYVIIALYNKEK